jgi:hypothetical protein
MRATEEGRKEEDGEEDSQTSPPPLRYRPLKCTYLLPSFYLSSSSFNIFFFTSLYSSSFHFIWSRSPKYSSILYKFFYVPL